MHAGPIQHTHPENSSLHTSRNQYSRARLGPRTSCRAFSEVALTETHMMPVGAAPGGASIDTGSLSWDICTQRHILSLGNKEQAFSPVVKMPTCHVRMPGFASQLWLLTPAPHQCKAWERALLAQVVRSLPNRTSNQGLGSWLQP